MKKHRLATLFAVLVGLLSILPSILAPLAVGGDYAGMQFLYIDDEDIYRARIHEVMEGHIGVASPYFFEYKDMPVMVPPINEWLYALPAFFFGLSFVITLSKFLFPALLFLLIYVLTRSMAGDSEDAPMKWGAITAGLFVTLGYDLIDYQSLFGLLNTGIDAARLSVWTRLVNPVSGALMVFSFPILLWWIVIRRYRHVYIPAGVLLALMVGYFFSFGISVSVLAALIVIFFFRKEFVVVRELIYTFIIALILDAPYWYHTLSSVSGEGGREVALRNGMFFTHAPVLNKVLILATIFFILSLLYARVIKRSFDNARTWLFGGGLLLGSWIALNQQVITGRAIWYHHFVQYTIPIAAIVVMAVSLLVWRRYHPRIWSLVVGVVFVASLGYGILGALSYTSRVDDFRRVQEYAQFFSFLNVEAPNECVVLIKEYHEELERLIPAYTNCNVYSSTYTFSGVPKERVLHNYLLRIRLNGVDEKDIRSYLFAHEDEVRGYFYADWDQLFGKGEDEWLRRRIDFLSAEYGRFLEGDLGEEIARYRLDYLVSGEPLSPQVLHELLELTFMTKTANEYIYSFAVK